jgi:hypothetical protein
VDRETWAKGGLGSRSWGPKDLKPCPANCRMDGTNLCRSLNMPAQRSERTSGSLGGGRCTDPGQPVRVGDAFEPGCGGGYKLPGDGQELPGAGLAKRQAVEGNASASRREARGRQGGVRGWAAAGSARFGLAHAARALAVVAAFHWGLLLGADSGSPTPHQLKASLLYHFARYVEWPADLFGSPTEPVVIGLLEADHLEPDLVQLVSGRRVGKRPLAVRVLRAEEEVQPCHLVFLGSTDGGFLAEQLDRFRSQRVMTVGEFSQFLELGGVVNLTRVGSRYRFDIHAGAARREGLTLSSRLLDLAATVRR